MRPAIPPGRAPTVPAPITTVPAVRTIPAVPGRMPSPRRLPSLPAFLAALLAAFALIGVSSVPAAAHAALVATTPAAGAAVDRAPTTVSMRFGESVQVTADGIRVLGADGTRVDRGDAAAVPGRSDTVSATLRPGLGQGTYTVAWRVTSADSHPVHGAFAFSVGRAGTVATPLAGVDRGADPAVAALVHIARGAGYAGLALLVGAAGTGLLLGGTAGRSVLRTQTLAGGLTLTLSAALSLLAQGPYAAGTGLGSLFDPALLHATLSGRTGVAEAVRVVLAAALTLSASGRSPAKRPRGGRWARTASYALFVPLVALAATFSATGHPAAGRYVPLAFTADLLHLMAMGLWLGGLVALIALCTNRAAPPAASAAPAPTAVPARPVAPTSAAPAVPAPTAPPASVPPPSAVTTTFDFDFEPDFEPGFDFAATVRRFSPLAAWCVGVLALTGTLQSLRQLGSVGDLLSTGWGSYLVAKVAVVLALLALARRARRWTHRHAARRAAPSDEPAPTTLRTMRRTLALEASAGAVVLALTVMLAGSAPPSDRTPRTDAVARAAPASPVHLHAGYDTGSAGGSGTATALLTPGPDDSVTVDVTLTTADNTPAKPAELTAAMSLPTLHVGPLPLELKASSPGHWTATATLTPKGDWQLTLTIRTSDIDETTVTFPPTAA